MKLNYNSVKNKDFFTENNIAIPSFDIEKTTENTDNNPVWVHFGAGNIFRGFIARINQAMLNNGDVNTGIIAVDSFDKDIIDKIYKPFDNLTMLVRLCADGNMEKEVIAGVSRAYYADTKSDDYKNIVSAFTNKSLQMVSFTITEKGYSLTNADGSYLSVVESDIENGTKNPLHTMSIICSLLLERYNSGAYPIAMCSMDNCSHNGEKLHNAIAEIATKWLEKGYVSKEFVDYINDENKVSFPWSMIDKITPRPAEEVENVLTNLGFEDMKAIVTSRNTYIAPFVNAETPEYLVIEDKFPNGRPKLETGGVFVTDRDTVNMVETMKVTTCLNPLHTALAVYGCILGYTRIFEEMRDTELNTLVQKIGYHEGMKVVVDPKIIDPKAFIDEVVNERLANPFIPDDPRRIATDTSQKVGIRFGETIKSYMKDPSLNAEDLTFIPLAIAGWLRYLLAVDDNGIPFDLSPDPLLKELTSKLSSVKIGGEYNGELSDILNNTNIFGVDLKEAGLYDKIENMFKELIKGKCAVRKALTKYTKQ